MNYLKEVIERINMVNNGLLIINLFIILSIFVIFTCEELAETKNKFLDNIFILKYFG